MPRPQNLWLPLLALDRCSTEPLHFQLSRQIAEAIRAEDRREARLPSTRMLAKLLGLSRNTVLAAYDNLAADDLIRGERGSGMRVNVGSGLTGMRALGLRRVIREARYPAHTVSVEDPDGNPIWLNF